MDLKLIHEKFNEEQKKHPFRYMYENVFEVLGLAIATMEISPGEFLYEKELTETLNLSRTPVRQALNMLVDIYFLSHETKQGYMVRKIEKKDFLDLHAFRKAIEPAMAFLSAQSPQTEDLEILYHILKKMKHSSFLRDDTNQNIQKYARTEECFHQQIAKMSRNSYLVHSYNIMRLPLIRVRHTIPLLELKQEEVSDVYTEHFQIYLAIKLQNPTMAMNAMLSHLDEPRLFSI